jgi:DNA invertase Pin-like site-specific DNA recombinase
MSKGGTVAFYARVSSDAQARDHTIDSQVAALKDRIAADGHQLEPDHGYVDDGYSGTNLQRAALERLRDAVADGQIVRLYVHAPDRLARRHAEQVLLIEEFRRAGVEVIFLNRSIGATAEDELLLQVQAGQDSGARSARTPARRALRPGQRVDRRAVWISLHLSWRGWRSGAF